MFKNKINVIFMGSTDFSLEVLKKILLMSEINIVALVCQPDKKIGRKQEIVFSEIKSFALENDIAIFQPDKIGTMSEELKTLNPDLVLTCAYGQFLPSKILNIAKLNLNIHASLLPKLRGGAPIQWAIINNFNKTGISFIDMVLKMDAGNIYVQEEIIIDKEETYYSLKLKLINLTLSMIDKYLIKIYEGKIISFAQKESEVTFGLNINRNDELINWDKPAHLISCHVRGLFNIPIAYSILDNNLYKIHKVLISNEISKKEPGTIEKIDKLGIHVATKDYNIIIKEIQPASKKVIVASNYFGSKQFPIQENMKFNGEK